jgi:hypothetical protein
MQWMQAWRKTFMLASFFLKRWLNKRIFYFIKRKIINKEIAVMLSYKNTLLLKSIRAWAKNI